jgi:cytochrome c553
LGSCAAILLGSWLAAAGETEPPPQGPASETSSQAAFFEKRIRPVLVAQCYGCHAKGEGRQVKGGLALDSRAGVLQGGDSGPVVVPGKPEESLLITALSHTDPALAMPPKKRLPETVLADFTEWVRNGAVDPREKEGGESIRSREAATPHWSFQPPRKVSTPTVEWESWPQSDIDRFVLARLEERQLRPVQDADWATLLRRVTFDLIGLPPTPEEQEAFLAAPSPSRFEQVVDRLLASPAFGEKWARHWLDVARYAESTGKTVNFNYPHAWRYRDYVIAAFQNDKPYDRFIIEQLAGDLLPYSDLQTRAEQLVATGFLAIGPKTLNERSGLKFELDLADEQIDVTSQAFLGVTVACARCHDHKVDPIPQADYYALAGIFRSTETCYGTVAFINARRTAPLLPLPPEAFPPSALSRLTDGERQQLEGRMADVRRRVDQMQDPTQKFLASGQISLLQARLDAYESDGWPKLLAMGVRDKPAGREGGRGRRFGGFAGFTADGSRTIADSPLYERGESDQPSSRPIPRGTIHLPGMPDLRIPSNMSGRLQLAEWIASRDNPLTARVFVNRLWYQLFGRGLVPTPDDFGQSGLPPSHPELLDQLSLQFMDGGWRVKSLVRSIVLSRVYRLGSQADTRGLEIDPDNTLLWRNTPRRLGAEQVRDAILAVSGQLDLKAPVGSAVALAGEGPSVQRRPGGNGAAGAINDPTETHRSVYLPIVRDNLPEVLALFDAADPSLISSDRPQTTVASQGLFLLNNALVIRAADLLTRRLMELGTVEERLTQAYRLCHGRPPSPREIDQARGFLETARRQREANGQAARSDDREDWSALCQALLASAEFLYRL